MENTELSTLLDDQPQPEPETPEQETEVEKGEQEAVPESQTEQPEPTDAKPEGETPAPEPKPEAPTVPLDALKDERRKRQDLERRLNAIEAEKQKQPAPDQFEDPEGYQKWQDTQLNERLFNQKCNMSRAVVVMQHGEDDFLEKEAAFNEAAERDPTLLSQAAQAELPALFMYQQGEAHLKRQEIGDPADFEQRVRAKVEAELEGKVNELAEAKVKELLSKHLPNSLAEEVSTAERSTAPKWEGPTPLSKIIGD